MRADDKSVTGNWYWPTVHDEASARKAARSAFVAAVMVSCVTGIFTALALFGTSLSGVTPWNLVDVVTFAVLAFGIDRMSRVAAVVALVWFGCSSRFERQKA